MISQYQPENYLDYLKYLNIYNQSNYFTYNCSKVIVYNTFSDKSTTIEMCNNNVQNIMHIF